MAKTKKATKATKTKTASTGSERSVLYVNVAPKNRDWVKSQASKAGVNNSIFADALIQFAKKNKFQFPSTGRA